jgi:hypothetical protein
VRTLRLPTTPTSLSLAVCYLLWRIYHGLELHVKATSHARGAKHHQLMRGRGRGRSRARGSAASVQAALSDRNETARISAAEPWRPKPCGARAAGVVVENADVLGSAC